MKRYVAYVIGLDNSVTVLVGNSPSKKDARRAAAQFIRRNPANWREFDELVVVREVTRVPVDLVVIGA